MPRSSESPDLTFPYDQLDFGRIDARDLIWLNATASLTGDCISSFIGEDIDGSWILGGGYSKRVENLLG